MLFEFLFIKESWTAMQKFSFYHMNNYILKCITVEHIYLNCNASQYYYICLFDQ